MNEFEQHVLPPDDQEGAEWDLEGRFQPPPNVAVKSFDWHELYKWSPGLRQRKDADGTIKIVGRRSDIAQAILYHLGKPLRLDHHAFMLPVYNANMEHGVLKCSRQVAKSSTIAIMQAVESIERPHWRSLYVSPSALQTRQYSNEKLRPTLYDSPFVRDLFLSKTVIDQVFEKTLLNGSYMFLRYAFLTPARARGIPASRVFFDEAQDLLKDNIKIISQSLSASRLSAGVAGRELIAGTPLTFSNTLEEYWRWSNQCEWLVPCAHHSPRYWNLLGAENIGPKGLICAHRDCRKPLYPATGQWVQMAPGELYEGFHITQLMVPWKQSEDAWKTEIYLPSQKWPESKFNNEILGVSFDNASSPVSRMDLERCSHPNKRIENVPSHAFHFQRHHVHSGMRVFAGVDWGEGRPEGEMKGGRKHFASWTVLTIGGYILPDVFWPFMMKRYTGKDIDPEAIIPDILYWMNTFRVECIGADWGHGWGVNSRLMRDLGKQRVMQFNYSTSLGERKRWDGDAYKWIINRNAVMNEFFQSVKEEQFMFPAWGEFEPYAKDILAEYVEYNERTRTMLYDHPIDQPDDALHSLIYCKLAADILMNAF